MKIKTNTWHYKLWLHSYYAYSEIAPKNTNLCQYVRRMFLHILIMCLAVTLIGTLLVLMSVLFGYYCFWRHPLGSFEVVGGVVLSGVAVFLVIPAITHKVQSKKPGIVRQYISAKKDKMCPLIEFDRS